MKSADTSAWRLAARLKIGLRTLQAFMGTPLARRLVLGLFVVQAVILVWTVSIGTPPDETNHIQFIDYYAHHSLSPIFNHQQPTYNLGDKTREVDYLYHYAMSLLVRIMPFSFSVEYHIVRLFSVLFGLLTFMTLGRLFKMLGVSAAAITVGLLVLTNLPMVLMMSSAVNNDVLVWLGAVLGFLLLVRLWKQPTTLDLAWLLGLSLVGGLVKRTLLPLGLVFGILGLVVFARRTRTILAGFKRFNWQLGVACVVIVLGSVLFAERVGGNLVRYHSITPSCAKVQGDAACYGFWANVRARTLAQLPPEKPMPLVEFPVRWLGSSFTNVVDIQTQNWRHQVKPARFLTPLLVALLAVGIIYGLFYEKNRYKTDQRSRYRLYIMLITLYFLVVHLIVNYGEYKKAGFFGVALNGRYILPSLLPLVVFASFYWSRLLGRHQQQLTLLAIVAVTCTIAFSGLELMLRNPQLYTS